MGRRETHDHLCKEANNQFTLGNLSAAERLWAAASMVLFKGTYVKSYYF